MVGLLETRQTELHQLCLAHGVRRLSLFGSAARAADFDPEHSDLDFLVEFSPMSASQKADAYFGLLFGLEALFGRSVDLVSVEGVKNPYVQRSIAADQQLLYAA